MPGLTGYTVANLLVLDKIDHLRRAFPALRAIRRPCLVCLSSFADTWPNIPTGAYSYTLEDMIEHLNDYHRWSREAIADWVEANE